MSPRVWWGLCAHGTICDGLWHTSLFGTAHGSKLYIMISAFFSLRIPVQFIFIRIGWISPSSCESVGTKHSRIECLRNKELTPSRIFEILLLKYNASSIIRSCWTQGFREYDRIIENDRIIKVSHFSHPLVYSGHFEITHETFWTTGDYFCGLSFARRARFYTSKYWFSALSEELSGYFNGGGRIPPPETHGVHIEDQICPPR